MHAALKVKRTLSFSSVQQAKRTVGSCLPQRHAQTPDGLDFQARGFGRTNPLGIVDPATIVAQTRAKRRGEVVSARRSVGHVFEHVAIEVAHRPSNNDRNNDESDEEGDINSSDDQVRKEIVEKQNERDGAV